jgi:hypothetical protein
MAGHKSPECKQEGFCGIRLCNLCVHQGRGLAYKDHPHAFPMVRLFTEPVRDSGPNKSNAVDQKGGDGPMACAGSGAMICSPNFLSLFLHVKHAFFTALAFKCALMIHTLDFVCMIFSVGLLQIQKGQ